MQPPGRKSLLLKVISMIHLDIRQPPLFSKADIPPDRPNGRPSDRVRLAAQIAKARARQRAALSEAARTFASQTPGCGSGITRQRMLRVSRAFVVLCAAEECEIRADIALRRLDARESRFQADGD
jgi:hypothetical protein